MLSALIIILFTASCKKGTVQQPGDDNNENRIDYSLYNFNEMASASGSSITDTLWNAKKDKIIGFKLNKKANTDFVYPILNFDNSPLLNSIISLNELPLTNLITYKVQSNAPVPSVLINTYEPGFSVKDVTITSWADINSLIKNRVDQLKEDKTGTRDFIFNFFDYENLQLLFGEDVNIKSLFNIKNANYPNLTNTGILYYYERPTVSLNSLFEDRDFTKDISLNTLSEKNIARVSQVKFGKIGYMVADVSTKLRPLVSRISGNATFSDQEISDINGIDVFFFLRGFDPSNTERINQLSSTFEKIKEFKKIIEQTSYNASGIGIPLYYTLRSHTQTITKFNSAGYNRQINLNK